MKFELSDKAAEILNYMAKLHFTDFQFLMDQIIIFHIETLLSDARNITPEKRGHLFEDDEYPCAVNLTIDDCFQEFQEIEKAHKETFDMKIPHQMNLFREILTEKLAMN